MHGRDHFISCTQGLGGRMHGVGLLTACTIRSLRERGSTRLHVNTAHYCAFGERDPTKKLNMYDTCFPSKRKPTVHSLPPDFRSAAFHAFSPLRQQRAKQAQVATIVLAAVSLHHTYCQTTPKKKRLDKSLEHRGKNKHTKKPSTYPGPPLLQNSSYVNIKRRSRSCPKNLP